jgi:hypothetical protein
VHARAKAFFGKLIAVKTIAKNKKEVKNKNDFLTYYFIVVNKAWICQL